MVHKQHKMRSLWKLHSEVTFLNHGSFGGCPIQVLQTQSEYRDELESEPVSFFLERYPVYLDQTRRHWGHSYMLNQNVWSWFEMRPRASMRSWAVSTFETVMKSW